ncbi:flagellar M-ring protein FliF [Candidatus Thiodiazotropha endoloripes]|uniref:flagellar basal-body MS-ring/collar protein FliF n=1 Tax=Candidatus Thiodiazotropha endoloripes TaxID=1818881 RepID=UPI00083CD7C0|nr:flagellar basal-body MS-ring/collar protein FliF [Candidatus Thiodiazotropha endoloripes]ODB85639.1 flagellar M-ring protein FliF [Candidatus Thiodiazotropha endoloripes]
MTDTWRNTGITTKGGLIIGVVSIILLSFFAVWWLLQAKQGVLFNDLEQSDAAAVVSELDKMKIKYKLTGDGTKILVPQDQIHEIRLKLLGNGLPLSGGVGFELFDKAEFGMTEFAQRINFQRAMQGELSRTITSLKEVKFARVHLVMPEASLFQKDKSKPSAAITIFLKPGANLERNQIEGIQRLVSASVPSLAATDVTIVDQYGKTLSVISGDDNPSAVMTTQLQKKIEVEKYLTEKSVRLLEQTFGPGKAIVSVDVTLDFNQSKTTLEEILPGSTNNGNILRKRETRIQPVKKNSKQKSVGEIDTEIEYRHGRSVEQIVSSPGGIQRLSIGVLVPQNSTPNIIQQVKDLVSMSVGLDLLRGDVIAVHAAEQSIFIDESDTTLVDGVFEQDVLDTDNNVSFTPMSEAKEELSPVVISKDNSSRLRQTIADLFDTSTDTITILGLIIVLLMIFTVFIISKNNRKRIKNSQQLAVVEREQILKQLKTWINSDELAFNRKGESA